CWAWLIARDPTALNSSLKTRHQRTRRCLLLRRWFTKEVPRVKAHPAAELLQFFKFSTRERSDLVTPVCMAALSAFGVFFIYSAQMATSANPWLKQVAFLALGAVV